MKTLNASTKTTKFAAIAVAAGQNDILGLLFGAAIGGIVGSNIGSGRGKLVATAAGTLIGAGIGSLVANGSTGYTRPASPRTVYVPQRTTPTRIVYVPVRPQVHDDHDQSSHHHGRKWRRAGHGHVPRWVPPHRHHRGNGYGYGRRHAHLYN